MTIRVIGVGSAHGDDAAGLEVADRLRSSPLPARVDVVTCARPGLDLLDALAGADAVVIVDAMQSGRPAGSVARIPVASLRAHPVCSSHGLGVAEALGLAAALGRMPRRMEVVGIEAVDAGDGALSDAVARGVEAAVEEVGTLIRQIQREATEPFP